MEQLIHKQYRDYDRTSRYEIFPFYYDRFDEKYVYGTTSHIDIDNLKYITHRVVLGDTLDTLALYYYNNPTYFWIIADSNRIQDPYEDLKVGSLLKIPTFGMISFDMKD